MAPLTPRADTHPLGTIAAYYQGLQDGICAALSALDGAPFAEESWERPEGGGGRSRVLTGGTVFEKAGVGFSHVLGQLPDHMKGQGHSGTHFDAMGVSLVIHPRSPMVPTIHMNVRHFRVEGGAAWFGGGIDLSPAYVFADDAAFFHGTLQQVCKGFGAELYPAFKDWCDAYFTIKHRHEMRGIGGIFYDYLGATHPERYTGGQALPPLAPDMDLFAFNSAVGNAFAPMYTELVQRRIHLPFSGHEREWQLVRRGRYAEFNLVYDRGTTFGLQTNGRVESILMSLPPLASWIYNHPIAANSAEAESAAAYQPRAWAKP